MFLLLQLFPSLKKYALLLVAEVMGPGPIANESIRFNLNDKTFSFSGAIAC